MKTIETLLARRQLPALPSTREEALALLAREEYGPVPPAPKALRAEPLNKPAEQCAGHATYEEALLRADMGSFEASFPIRCVIPKNKPAAGLPAFVFINFRAGVPDWYFPAEEIADNGFAVLFLCYNDVTRDEDDGYSTGIAPDMIREFGPTSKISLWAWACSRVLDWALSRGDIDPNRVAVIGHSRLGKTSLWAGANDERFSCVISNDSGCSGAAISRGKIGESVARISHVFPHWSVPAYKAYAQREYEAPFDQHFLLAAVAPRKLYVASASLDDWADPASEYLGCCAASSAWESAGKKGFVHPDRLPETGDRFAQGDVAYHLREGAHYLSRQDWLRYMEFLA